MNAVAVITEIPEKSRNETRDNAGTHTNTESQRQTQGQLTTQHWVFGPPEFSWAPVLLSILPLCPGSVLLPRSRDPGWAPKCCARCLNPRVGREKATGKKGKFLTDSSQGPLPHPMQWCRSDSPEPKLLHKFIGWAHAVGLSGLVTSLQSNFLDQNFHTGRTFLGVSTPFLIS